MNRVLLTLAAVMIFNESLMAVTVDFESLNLNEGDAVIDQIPGMTFTHAHLYIAGGNAGAGAFGSIYGSDITQSNAFGNQFISDLGFHSYNTIEIMFDTPVNNLTFQVADIESSNAIYEDVTVTIYDTQGRLLQSEYVAGTDPLMGDGIVYTFTFNLSDIKRVEIDPEPFNYSGSGLGWGIDNISFDQSTTVPAPLAVVGGLCLITWVMHHRKGAA